MENVKLLLQPLVVLVMWPFVMWLWMYATRIPAMTKMKMRLDPQRINGQQMSELPATVRWMADKSNNVLEHPPLFYSFIIGIVIFCHSYHPIVTLPWVYV